MLEFYPRAWLPAEYSTHTVHAHLSFSHTACRCLLDFQPRSFPASHYQMLAHMAELVVRELEAGSMLMWNALALEEARSGVRRLIRGLDCFTGGPLLLLTCWCSE